MSFMRAAMAFMTRRTGDFCARFVGERSMESHPHCEREKESRTAAGKDTKRKDDIVPPTLEGTPHLARALAHLSNQPWSPPTWAPTSNCCILYCVLTYEVHQ